MPASGYFGTQWCFADSNSSLTLFKTEKSFLMTKKWWIINNNINKFWFIQELYKSQHKQHCMNFGAGIFLDSLVVWKPKLAADQIRRLWKPTSSSWEERQLKEKTCGLCCFNTTMILTVECQNQCNHFHFSLNLSGWDQS